MDYHRPVPPEESHMTDRTTLYGTVVISEHGVSG